LNAHNPKSDFEQDSNDEHSKYSRITTKMSGLDQIVQPNKVDRKKLRHFVHACEEITREDRLPMTQEMIQVLEDLRMASADPIQQPFSWVMALSIAVLALIVAGFITWGITKSVLPTVYMALGMSMGSFGIARIQPECAAIGGMLAKALAWYLAPTLANMDQFKRYLISVGLAALLEYPFLTYANAMAMKAKTALRLRAIQDAVDIVLTFIMVALSGIGMVDVFAITQALLALLRVAVATLGPRFCLPSKLAESKTDQRVKPTVELEQGIGEEEYGTPEVPPASSVKMLGLDERRGYLQTIVQVYPSIVTKETPQDMLEWFAARKLELSKLPERTYCDAVKANLTKQSLVCITVTLVGLGLGVIGFTVTKTDPYILGISGVLGMGLAWYVGPSLKDRPFVIKWAVSVFLLLTLEYPFLTEANNRAAVIQHTFMLRAVQDLTGLIVSTTLITVLSNVQLNRIDFFQLAIGILRVVVVTRFFWTI
jgi:uncharacterized protein (DUF486 family)